MYRYTYGGGSYGIITGYTPCNVTTEVTILINGYSVIIPAGDATLVANAIASANITNVTASSSEDNILTIQVTNTEIAQINEKLVISVVDTATLSELGFELYTQTQTILCPHAIGTTQFGRTIKFNEYDLRYPLEKYKPPKYPERG